MALIVLKQFGGMQPAIDDRLLPPNSAANAQNSWVYDGKLAGMRIPRLMHTLLSVNTRAIFRVPKKFTGVANIQDSYWLEFPNQNTTVVKGAVNNADDPLYYWSSGTDEPRYTSRSKVVAASGDFILGVPAPAAGPTVTPAGGVSGITETRAYAFTHLTSYGEEGPPSPPSAVTTGKIDDTWALAIPAVGGDATDRDITHTNIYRTITSDQGIATYYFVAQLAIATVVYNDTISSAVVALNEQLTSTLYDPPPTDLVGMVTMPNGMIIGWRENELWFCEPYLPHAWPASYQLSTEFNIVGIGVFGQTAVICTAGVPYTCTGVHPSSMSLAKVSGLPEPCVSQGSVVSAPEGVYYASPAGLVLVGPGTTSVATYQLISKDRWQSLLNVANLNAAMLSRAYVTFSGTNVGCFEDTAFENTAFELIDFTGTRNGALIDMADARVGFTTLTSVNPTYNVMKDPWTNEVLIIRDGGVYQLDTTARQPQGEYLWRSKIYQLPRETNFGCGKIFWEAPVDVDTPSTILRVYGDGVLIHTVTVPPSGDLFRFPAGRRYNHYQFELEGDLLISMAHFATTPKELAGV